MAIEWGGSQILSTVILVYIWIMLLVAGPSFVFFYLKDVQPVRARSPVLMAITYICLCGTSIHYYTGALAGHRQCVPDVWAGAIFGWALSFAYLVRSWRLLWIFNLTKYKLDENTEKIKDSKWKIWNNENMIKDSRLICLFCVMYFTFFVFPIAATVQGVTDAGTAACDSIANEAGSVLVLIFMIIMFITIAVKLAKVHDGYFLKYEFKALGIMQCVYGLPLILVNFGLPDKTAAWGQPLYMLELAFAVTVTFMIPLKMAYVNYKEESGHSSASNSESITASKSQTILNEATQEEDSTAPADIFPGHRKIAKLIEDKELSYRFIQEYLVHYQDMKMGAYFLFWNQINEFRNTKDQQQLAGKAYLLFQKYLKQNAYRHIDCCPNDLVVRMEDQLTAATQENATVQIKNHFFDEAIQIVEGIMVEELFKPFFSSEYYQKYKEATRLNVGVNEVVLKS